MLSLGILFYNFFPGPQHFIHAIYYLIRAYFTENVKPRVDFADLLDPPISPLDLICIPFMTLMLTVPKPSSGDYVFAPYIILHTMGYGAPVWYSVLGGAFFTMYIFWRPQVLFMCIGAIVSKYIRGDNKRVGLVIAAGFHLILSAFEPFQFGIIPTFIVLFMAEAKLRMQWEYELIPPVYPSVNVFAAPVYLMNTFIWGWAHKWKYTDKVWKSFDIAFVITNVCMGLYLHNFYTT